MELLDDFQSALQRCGGRLVGERYYGVWDGFPFSAHIDQVRAPGAVVFSFRLTAALERRLFQTLRKSLPKGCQLTAAANSSYRLACAGRPLRRCEQRLDQVLSALTRGFRESGLVPADLCPLCGRPGCDAYTDVGGYAPVHRACVEALAETSRAQAETALRSGSYLTGLLGALLGALAASIPTIAANWAGWLVAYFYALIPLGAYYGYKLFRGRMDSAAFVCTCLASVLQLFTIEQFTFYIAVQQAYDIWPSVLDTVRFYFQVMTPGDMLADMGMSAVFMALGLWISWDRIRRTAHTDLGAANTVQAALVDRESTLY